MALRVEGSTDFHRTYPRGGPIPAETAYRYLRHWEKRIAARPASVASAGDIPPTICLSRRIGAGAREIADLLAKKMNYRIADRMIIDTIARDSDVTRKTIAYFDERYPGRVSELALFLFGEKSSVMSNYARSLISVVFALAESAPTIFIGRGAHLILPRERVLAVCLACLRSYRIQQLMETRGTTKDAAEKHTKELDAQQRDFFLKVFGKKAITFRDFDFVINCDQIERPAWVAEIVECAFNEKFPPIERPKWQATDNV